MTTHHWMTPLKGLIRPTRHVLLWQDEEAQSAGRGRRSRRLLPGRRRLWVCDATGKNLVCGPGLDWTDADDLTDKLLRVAEGTASLTVWTVRGWSDLVLTGLAELIESGQYVWRYALLDGARCLFRGQLRGVAVTITSLPCWTGGRWDSWEDCPTSQPAARLLAEIDARPGLVVPPLAGGERLAVATWQTILSVGYSLNIGTTAPTVAGGAKKLWRTWLGPRLWKTDTPPPKRGQKAVPRERCYVAPLPSRPDAAAHAERHVCYGLPREQYVEGRVEGPIYVADVRSAYLLALLAAPMPMAYRDRMANVPPTTLADALCGHTGLALVSVESLVRPWPVRRNRAPGRAVGRYWTWLAGAELASALCMDAVREVHTAWIWSASAAEPGRIKDISEMGGVMRHDGAHGLARAWRGLYSAAVGQFAAWARTWEDVSYPHSFGRWSVWSGADPQTGEICRYRSIAGRVQRLASRGDAPGSVPLMFGCVTAQLRTYLDYLMGLAGPGNVVACMSDALWVTHDGWQSYQRAASAAGGAPDNLSVKAVYDRAWLTGRGRAVVERDGKRYAILSGVPNDLAADDRGRVAWESKEDWPDAQAPRAARGVGSRTVVFDTNKVVKENDFPARPYCPWLVLRDGLLPEELLTPRRAARRVDDDDGG